MGAAPVKGESMIEGFHADIAGAELQAHLEARAAYHEARERQYGLEITRLEAGRIEAMPYTGGDPVRALRDKQSEHAAKAEEFHFLAGHLVLPETYRLSRTDLQEVEFLTRRWG